ncbi:MAG: SDR family oxidoreductase [Parachlamydiaceae bacterium]
MAWTLITGGSKGLGQQAAQLLAQKGYSLVIHYRSNEKEAKQTVEICRSHGVEAEHIQGDFKTTDDITRFIEVYLARFPDTKHLINNVGSYFLGSTLKTPLTRWNEIFLTNLHLPFLLCNRLAPSIKTLQGTIMMIGVAGLGSSRADTYSSAYTIAKAALLQMTKSLAKELLGTARVNMISPGYLENAVDLPEDLAKLPLKRPTSLKEAAELIAFLMDEQQSSITGQNIEISGGVRL